MHSADRLGVLGGTFNPLHNAHLLLAQEAWYRYELGRVILVPAARNPLKDADPEGAAPDQRLRMLKLACDRDARFSVDGLDIRSAGPSYMVNTLTRLRGLYPESELYLLLGADSALTLPKWKDVSKFAELCRVIVSDRPGSSSLLDGFPSELIQLGLRLEFMPLPPVDLSASLIRQRVRQGKPIRYMVPDVVAEFIHEAGLYL